MRVGQNRPKRQQLSDVIVEDVKRWIVAERKQPGDRLPNEKELIELFGYSKSTVREALKALEVRGLGDLLPLVRAYPSAINPAPCSWRGVT